ncbi:MAG TPA: type II toxin-antitoxin system HicA family toxin [Syntrophales bacterium]|jgi:predicted RNA binding protein YcfA (HicA-like mRNA interferase family)|nr:type II toxin-antitoxin system HicA family toxin [Syntrophales bacterium]HPX57095.1 type II toxin-antitoxin system HicA family toxin [Syntrophales bacterium]
MPELPHISGNEAINLFERMGFKVVRQRGSHVVLRKDDRGCVIPLHKELAVGTLRSAIKQAGITDADFINAYKNR